MTAPHRRLAQAAADLVGTPFRLHGRDPATGLDCIGLLGAALARCGRPAALPAGYTLRVAAVDRWLPDPASLGFAPATGAFRSGDVVLVRPGPGQAHLAITAPDAGWIHAHAGLKRVVHQPGALLFPLLHHWRLAAPD